LLHGIRQSTLGPVERHITDSQAEMLVKKWLLDLAPACAIAFRTDRLVNCVVADIACLIYSIRDPRGVATTPTSMVRIFVGLDWDKYSICIKIYGDCGSRIWSRRVVTKGRSLCGADIREAEILRCLPGGSGHLPCKDQAPESRDDLKSKLQKQEVDSFLLVCSWRSANTRSSYSTRNIY
jgi:hypothetical protein